VSNFDLERDHSAEQALAGQIGGSRAWLVRCFQGVDSTMNAARTLICEVPRGAAGLLLAKTQHAGRGRQGRSWEQPHSGLYATFIFPVTQVASHFPSFSLVVALTVAEVLQQFGCNVLLKWPNDLHSSSAKKLGGILLEFCREGDRNTLLVGIGLNLSGAPAAVPNAGSLREECGVELSALSVASALCPALYNSLDMFLQEGFSAFRAKWLSYSYPLGEQHAVHVGQDLVRGVYRGITQAGMLELEVNGAIREFASAEIV